MSERGAVIILVPVLILAGFVAVAIHDLRSGKCVGYRNYPLNAKATCK